MIAELTDWLMTSLVYKKIRISWYIIFLSWRTFVHYTLCFFSSYEWFGESFNRFFWSQVLTFNHDSCLWLISIILVYCGLLLGFHKTGNNLLDFNILYIFQLFAATIIEPKIKWLCLSIPNSSICQIKTRISLGNQSIIKI